LFAEPVIGGACADPLARMTTWMNCGHSLEQRPVIPQNHLRGVWPGAPVTPPRVGAGFRNGRGLLAARDNRRGRASAAPRQLVHVSAPWKMSPPTARMALQIERRQHLPTPDAGRKTRA